MAWNGLKTYDSVLLDKNFLPEGLVENKWKRIEFRVPE